MIDTQIHRHGFTAISHVRNQCNTWNILEVNESSTQSSETCQPHDDERCYFSVLKFATGKVDVWNGSSVVAVTYTSYKLHSVSEQHSNSEASHFTFSSRPPNMNESI